jgi:hypothetical protein
MLLVGNLPVTDRYRHLTTSGAILGEPMSEFCRQHESPPMTFPEILSDPLIRAIMKADHVDPDTLKSDLGRIARELRTSELRTPSGRAC